ncbi:complement C1q-like protein 2 [Mya arenaria]|uniref:complement C1q-like protein 2 n=1 Tax=Mya arenaria TaxID=6604 RepID=UPI0022E55F4A|nr:complement C1q-like protein 2 [Mya arenaria]
MGEVIVYKTVETNQGNGYSATTGKVTASAEGLYLFFMRTCTSTNNYAYLYIVKEGSVLMSSVQIDQQYYSCTSSQAFVHLDVGETVWGERFPRTGARHASALLNAAFLTTVCKMADLLTGILLEELSDADDMQMADAILSMSGERSRMTISTGWEMKWML